jgi:hypothetical protein
MDCARQVGVKNSLVKIVIAMVAGCAVSGCGGDFVDHPSTYSWVFRTNPPPEIQVTRSTFWQSSHFTYEYSVFMELTNATRWAEEFRASAGLVATNLPSDWEASHVAGDEAPAWFMPKTSSSYEVWVHTNLFKSDLLLARDLESGLVFFFDQQF